MDYATVVLKQWKKNHHFWHRSLIVILLFQLLWMLPILGQNADRLIIFQGPQDVLLGQANTLTKDFSSVFLMQDISVISAGQYLPEEMEVEALTSADYKAGLEILLTSIEARPGSIPLIAFIFIPGKGPDVFDVIRMLEQCPVPVKILTNTYFRTDLMEVVGRSPLLGGVTFMQYGIGAVIPRNEAEPEKDIFPLIPVIGGAVAVVTGIVLITGDGGSVECSPVTASWDLPGTLCSDGTPIQLQITGTPGGIWSGVGVDPLGNFNPGLGTQSITYTVGEGKCERVSTQEIIVLQSGDASWTPPDFLCDGSSAILTSDGNQNGQWSGEGIADNGNGTATFSPPDIGSLQVSYSAGEGICAETNTQAIEVLPVPDASWSPPDEICVEQLFELAPTGTPGGKWSGDGIIDNGDGTASFSQSSPGTYSVTYSVGKDCRAEQTQNISVIEQADASWTIPEPVCAGEIALLTPDGTIGGIWSGPGITDQGDGSATFEQAEAGTYTVRYTVGAGACADSIAQDMIVLSIPDPSWIAPSDICAGEVVTLMPSGTGEGNWTGDGVTDNGDGTATFIQPAAGTFTITYTVGTECISVLAQDIVVIEQGNASWTPPDGICAGESVTLVPDGTPGGIWTGDGVTDHGDGTATFLQNVGGTYAVTYTVGPKVCSESQTKDIQVSETPDPSWTAPEQVCVNEEIQLIPDGTQGGTWSGENVTADGFFSSGTPGSFDITYTVGDVCIEMLTQQMIVIEQADASWTPPEGNCSGTTINLVASGTQGGMWTGNQVTPNGVFSPGEAGEYMITYQVGDGACADAQTHTIIILQQSDASWTPPDNLCTGQEIQLTAEGTPGGIWSGLNVTADGLFSSGIEGNFDITYSVGEAPCQDIMTKTITVVEQSDPSWDLPDPPCPEETILLIPDGDPGGTWSGSGITDLGDGTAEFMQFQAGFYAVTYSVGDGACAAELTQGIEVVPLPDASWMLSNDIICRGEILDLVAEAGTWSGENVTDFGGGIGEFSSEFEGVFTITLTIGEGNCVASESHDVFVEDTEPPFITVPAINLIVECDGLGNINEFQDWIDQNGEASVVDNCGGMISWTAVFDDPSVLCSETLVTFTACDESDNCITTEANFIILDTTLPEFDNVPPDLAVTCENIPPPDAIGAIDICSGPLTTNVEDIQGPGCPFDIIRIYTATDACGNVATIQQTISVTDDIAPVAEQPPDMEVFCDFPCDPIVCLPEPEPIPFTDNCDPDVEISVEDMPLDIQPNFQVWQRIYTGTDECGNASSVVQMIFVQCIITEPLEVIPPLIEISTASPVNIFSQDLRNPELIQILGTTLPSNEIQETHLMGFDHRGSIDISSTFRLSDRFLYKAKFSFGVSPIFGSSLLQGSQTFVQGRSSMKNFHGSLVFTPKFQNGLQLEAGILFAQQMIDQVTVFYDGKSNQLNTLIDKDDVQFSLGGRYRFSFKEIGKIETEAILVPLNKFRKLHIGLKYVLPLNTIQTDHSVKRVK
jgi:hypothetical protein